MGKLLRVVLLTMLADVSLTEAYMDIRPMIIPPSELLPDCRMMDGKDVDFAVQWEGGRPDCVYQPAGKFPV